MYMGDQNNLTEKSLVNNKNFLVLNYSCAFEK